MPTKQYQTLMPLHPLTKKECQNLPGKPANYTTNNTFKHFTHQFEDGKIMQVVIYADDYCKPLYCEAILTDNGRTLATTPPKAVLSRNWNIIYNNVCYTFIFYDLYTDFTPACIQNAITAIRQSVANKTIAENTNAIADFLENLLSEIPLECITLYSPDLLVCSSIKNLIEIRKQYTPSAQNIQNIHEYVPINDIMYQANTEMLDNISAAYTYANDEDELG